MKNKLKSRWVLVFILTVVFFAQGQASFAASGIVRISPAKSDIVMTAGEASPTGSYTVKNISSETVTINVSDNASWLSLTPASFSLAPGTAKNVSYATTSLAAGIYAADIYFEISKASGNNAPVARILVKFALKVTASKTDLQVSSLTVAPASPLKNKPVKITAVLKNAGGKDSGPFKIKWTVNGVTYFNGTHPSLAAGATSGDYSNNLNFLKGLLAGTYTVQCAVDADNKIPESNEGNNAFSKVIKVA